MHLHSAGYLISQRPLAFLTSSKWPTQQTMLRLLDSVNEKKNTPSDRPSVPRAHSTILPPLQKSKNAAVVPWSNAARTVVRQHGGTSEDHNFHPNHRTDHLSKDNAQTQKTKNPQLTYPECYVFSYFHRYSTCNGCKYIFFAVDPCRDVCRPKYRCCSGPLL